MPKGIYVRTKPISQETRKKMSLARMGNTNGFRKGISSQPRGYKHSAEVREKLRISHLGKVGILSSNWKGGITTYERKLWFNRQRRIIKLGNGGSHTQEEWEKLKNDCHHICLCCGRKEPEITLSVDHIIPISLGGTDDIDNIQPLCRGCNSSKKNKVVKYKMEALNG